MSDFTITPETNAVNLVPLDLAVSTESEGLAIDGTPATNTANTSADPVTADSNIVPAGGGSIVKGFLKSPNYNAGNEGWKVDANGDVEFNDGNFRGDITGASGTFTGTVTVASINIGGDDTSSAHIDTDGNLWLGASVANKATAPARITNAGDAHFSNISLDTDVVLADLQAGSSLAVQYLTAGSITSKAITLAVAAGTGDSKIQAGKTDFVTTDNGFIIGLDDSDSDKAKAYFGTATDYFYFDGTSLVSSDLKFYEQYTAGAVFAAGEFAFIGSDGKAYHTDGLTSQLDDRFLGVAKEAVAIDATGTFQVLGKVIGLSSLTAGTKYYTKVPTPTGETSTTTDTYNACDDDGNSFCGQTFQVATTKPITHIRIKLYLSGSSVTDLALKIYATAAGIPTGGVLATSSGYTPTLTGTTKNIDFYFATPFVPVASTTYCFVTSGSSDAFVRCNRASSGYANGTAITQTDGGAWTAKADDLIFGVYQGTGEVATTGSALLLGIAKSTTELVLKH